MALLALMVASCAQATGSSRSDVTASSTTVSPALVRPATNLHLRRLAAGERPPQFVLFSFDGVGVSPNWDLFLDTAQKSGARFTALMTGLYFLTTQARGKYRGPGHLPGEAAIGFGGAKAEVIEQIEYLNRTYYAGHEMGTHYVGHFCRGDRYPGARWTTADWNAELDQFFALMRDWRANTGITTGPDLAFGPGEVRGGRTQCLEGTPAALYPALRRHGFTWDSSIPAKQKGLGWPEKINGIWEFAVPYAYSPPLGKAQTALDYNFWFTVNRATNVPGDAPKIRNIVRESYRYMYDRAYAGNRAPLVIANHFNDWNNNAFNPATADFMAEVCTRPQTVCATHSDVVKWLELQDSKVLRELRRQPLAAVDATR